MTGLYKNDVGTASYTASDRTDNDSNLFYDSYLKSTETTLLSTIYNNIRNTSQCGIDSYRDSTSTTMNCDCQSELWRDTTSTSWIREKDEWYTSGNGRVVVRTPGERMREILRSRHAPRVITSRTPIAVAADAREMRARSTLRSILGDQFFRRFLRDGFITIVAKSGLVYRIFPGHRSTEVWDKGKKVETMCVVLKGSFPPTDELIMRYLLILNDEEQFSKHAVRSRVTFSQAGSLTLPMPQQPKSLPELFAEMKAVA